MHSWRAQACPARHVANRDSAWIPAFAGMTSLRHCVSSALRVFGVACLRRWASSAPRLASSRQWPSTGRHSRESGNPCRSIPSGVVSFETFEVRRAAKRLASMANASLPDAPCCKPRQRLDSRFRGNDESSALRVLGTACLRRRVSSALGVFGAAPCLLAPMAFHGPSFPRKRESMAIDPVAPRSALHPWRTQACPARHVANRDMTARRPASDRPAHAGRVLYAMAPAR